MTSVLRTSLPAGEERRRAGQALREKVRRSALGRWRPAEDRPDPVDLIEEAHEGRLQRLVPVRVGRMVASPYAFLRGLLVLEKDLESRPWATHRQRSTFLYGICGVEVSEATICRGIKRGLSHSRKKDQQGLASGTSG